MHIVRNQKPIGNLAPGEWLCQDTNAFELGLMAERGTCEINKWGDMQVRWGGGYRGNGMEIADAATFPKSILLIRSGAIGDLLLLTPAVRAVRAKYTKAQIWLCCNKRHWDIFAQGDTHFIEYPLPVSELAQFDLIIPLENVVELATEKGQHAVDAYAEVLGVTVTDYKPVYKVTEEEDANCRYDDPLTAMVSPRKRIAIQIHASAIIRGYHMENWGKVIIALLKLDWEIMLIGQHNPDVSKLGRRIKDCSVLSFREAAAVLATCDVFCGVDSSFYNLCPALGIPAVGLFGPVDARTRTIEALRQYALSGVGKCAPCGWTNSRAGHKFPPHGPCAQTGYCVPLAEIDPQRVVKKILEVAKK